MVNYVFEIGSRKEPITFKYTKKEFASANKLLAEARTKVMSDDRIHRCDFRQSCDLYEYCVNPVRAADVIHSMGWNPELYSYYLSFESSNRYVSDETIINCIDESDFMKIILYAIEIVISTDDIEKVLQVVSNSSGISGLDVVRSVRHLGIKSFSAICSEAHKIPDNNKTMTVFVKKIVSILTSALSHYMLVVDELPRDNMKNFLEYLAKDQREGFTINEYCSITQVTFQQAVSDLHAAMDSYYVLSLGMAYSYTTTLPKWGIS